MLWNYFNMSEIAVNTVPTNGTKESLATETKLKSLRQLSVCIVVNHLPSCIRKGYFPYDIAAKSLAQAGYNVTLLSIHSQELDPSLKHNTFIRFISLPYQGPPISSLLAAVIPYQVLDWMLKHASEFDVVHFPLTNGLAYYTLLAKHQRWAFQHIEFCVDIHSPTMWQKHIHKQWIDQVDDLAADFLEQESIRLADCIISRDNNILDWMKKQGWQLPRQVSIFPQACNQTHLMEMEYLNLHEKILTQYSFRLHAAKQERYQPLVSICMTHFNRPHYLAQALESIRAQDYSNFEVILVDDASTLSEALAYLDSLAEEFKSKDWKIIRNKKNLFPGAARNLAACQSRGEYLLFMDDDNYAKPNQISTFIQVARQVDTDILTCAMDVFEGDSVPVQNTAPIHRFLPLGAAAGVGLYLNIFGDMNALIKKKTYEALNGLTEEHGIGGEDWELFARAVLHGYHLETIPLALFWYRDTPSSITKTTHLYANSLRGIRSYLDAVPSPLRSNLILSQAQQERLQRLLVDYNSLAKTLQRCWQLFSLRAWRAICHPRRSIRKIIKFLFRL